MFDRSAEKPQTKNCLTHGIKRVCATCTGHSSAVCMDPFPFRLPCPRSTLLSLRIGIYSIKSLTRPPPTLPSLLVTTTIHNNSPLSIYSET